MRSDPQPPPRRQLAGLILASALITLDGTATTIALPAIGQDLGAPVFRLQWVSNAPLLVLAALLLPAGTLADRFGRVRLVRWGLLAFGAGALACAAAPGDVALIAGRFVQGAGGALILPAVLAILRGGFADDGERTRVLGAWAAWTGVASAVGPLMGGAFVDVLSWRAVYVTSAGLSAAAAVLAGRDAPAADATRRQPVPLGASLSLVVLLGATAYLMMAAAAGDASRADLLVPAVCAIAALLALVRGDRWRRLIPRELLRARNCLPANGATFALYFGMFGMSFLLALYTQQVLRYSAIEAALVLLPVSVMLFLAGWFGRLAVRLGVRPPIAIGAIAAAAGIAWMGLGPHPLPFWGRMIAGTGLFGLGISLAVSALTNAAVAAAPASCAGAASGLNHAAVRAAGLAAIALLGSLAAPGASDAVTREGFSQAMLVCAAIVGAGGLAGSVRLRDDAPGGLG